MQLSLKLRAGVVAGLLGAFLVLPALGEHWPEWRGGEAGSGVTHETDLPLHWSATENVRWKVPLPERGNSTPVVWGERVFITQAVGEERLVICFDRKDGRELWRGGAASGDPEPASLSNPPCSSSPATDGERVAAWFGSAGLYCFDVEGKELWRLDTGQLDHPRGSASSPVLHKNLCILQVSPGPRSYLLAVDKRTGKEAWRVELPPGEASKDRTDSFAGREHAEVGSWSTPIIVHIDGRDELILTLPGMVRAFAPETGKEIWRCGGLSPIIYPSAVYGEETVVAVSGYGGSELAVHAGGAGDVTETNRLWMHPRTKQRRGSGVISGGHFFILSTPGIAQCLDLKTGEQVWEARLRGSSPQSTSWSSMVLSGDRIYVLNQAGDTFVIRAGPQFEKLAMSSIGDGLTNASLAVSEGELFIRTHKHLWCIGARWSGEAAFRRSFSFSFSCSGSRSNRSEQGTRSGQTSAWPELAVPRLRDAGFRPKSMSMRKRKIKRGSQPRGAWAEQRIPATPRAGETRPRQPHRF